MLKIFQSIPQQYVNQELPDVQPGFIKVRETRDKIANIYWIIEKGKRIPGKKKNKKQNKQTNKKICFTYYLKAFHCVDHQKIVDNS